MTGSDLRRHEVRLSTIKVTVPDTQQTSNDGNVLLKWRLAEVLVHGIGAGEEGLEVVKTNVQSDAETNGTPDTVTSTNPALKAKHVLGIDAKLGHLWFICGQGNKVLGNVALAFTALDEPFLGAVGIGDGLGRGESLGGNEEECRLRVRCAQCLGHVRTVNVGDKVKRLVAITVELESLRHHHGSAT